MFDNYPFIYAALLLVVQTISDYYVPYIDNIGILWILSLLTMLFVAVTYSVKTATIRYRDSIQTDKNNILIILLNTLDQLLELVIYYITLFIIPIVLNKIYLINPDVYTQPKFYVSMFSLIFVILFILNFVKNKK